VSLAIGFPMLAQKNHLSPCHALKQAAKVRFRLLDVDHFQTINLVWSVCQQLAW
jgi:hypothetical protein